jgi:hypothetical protein
MYIQMWDLNRRYPVQRRVTSLFLARLDGPKCHARHHGLERISRCARSTSAPARTRKSIRRMPWISKPQSIAPTSISIAVHPLGKDKLYATAHAANRMNTVLGFVAQAEAQDFVCGEYGLCGAGVQYYAKYRALR